MRHLVYSVRYSSLLNVISSVKTTFFCKYTKCPSCPYIRLRLYVGTAQTNQNCFREKIMNRLYLVNAWYHLVQSLLSSSLLSENVKIKICRTAVLSAVFYRCQNVTLRDEHRLRLFENRVLQKMLGIKRDEITGSVEDCVKMCVKICVLLTKYH